ncbi:outer membrane beta-barrel protein [Minwuia sp.]|uniref:outer membrane beta-barrel protein n=1 Tax=Minwuia sp. TaxID=2493630 RepID=UPI003A9201D5
MAGSGKLRFGLCPAFLMLLAALAGSTAARAQGATDTSSEGQVRPTIIQNPIIPGNADPEPPFTTAKQDAVLQRRRDPYDPIGMEAGGIFRDIKYLGRGQILESFLLFPKVETEVVFDTNIFAEASNKTADFIGTVRPELELHSNWDNHEFFVRGFGEFGRYLRNNRESFRRHGVEIGGRLDVTEFLRINANTGWQRKTTARSDIEADTGGDEPTVFYESFGELRARYKRDKFLVDAKTKMTVFDFVDTPAGAGERENDQNDRWFWENSLRLGWEEWRGTTIFVEPFYRFSRNFINPDNQGVTRGFSSKGLTMGLTYDATAVTFLEAAVGIGFGDSFDGNADGFLFFAPALDWVWNPHDSWTFKAGYQRRITGTNSFTTVNGVNIPDVAFLTDEISLEAQLEVTFELLASAKLDIGLGDTLQNNTSQTSVDTELALLWLMNEHARLKGFWAWETLTSNDANREFGKHRVGVVLTLHY